DHVARPRTIPVLRASGGQIDLAAGQANMIRVGTRLALLPPGALPELVDLGALPVAEVSAVESTTSTARLVAGDESPAPTISAGAEAVVLSYGASLTRYVRLVAPGA